MNNAYLLDNPYGDSVGSGNYINADGKDSYAIAKINNAPILKIVNGKSQVVGYHQKGARVPSLGIKEIAINAVRKFRAIGQGSFIHDNKMFNIVVMQNGKPVLGKDVHVWIKNANGVAFRTDLVAKKGTPVSQQVYDFASIKKVKMVKFGNGNFGNANLYSFNSSSFDNGSDLLLGFDMDEDVMYNAAAPIVTTTTAAPSTTTTPIATTTTTSPTPIVTAAPSTTETIAPKPTPTATPVATPIATPTTVSAAPNTLQQPIITPLIATPMVAYAEPITLAPSSVLPTSTPPKTETTTSTKPASKGAVMGGGGGGMGGGGGAGAGEEGAKVAAVAAPVQKKILGMKPAYFYSIVGLAVLAGGIWAYKKYGKA